MCRRSSQFLSPLLTLTLGLHTACGKRADPLPPYLKTPATPSGLSVGQIGEEIEIQIVAPRTTTQNRPLPVIELEWLQAPPTGRFDQSSSALHREEVAPGEARSKRFPRPGSASRFSVRAISGKSLSAAASPILFTPAPVPPPPSGLQALNTPAGIELSWTNPPGAEPWPTASPVPNLQPKDPVLATPSSTPRPDTQAPGPEIPPPAATVVPPTAKPTPTTGIRIHRTNSGARLVREPLQDSKWLDSEVRPGDQPCYSVSYATSLKPLVESSQSQSVCVDVRDLVPPDPPTDLVADRGSDFVELSWRASPSSDTVSYRLYRSLETGPETLLLETEGLVLRVHDRYPGTGPRTYKVVAVDRGGHESLTGPTLKIVIP